MSAKKRKAMGNDMLPNEVLKNDNTINLLQQLIQLCLDTGKVPDEWTKAIIKPIPKSSENDPRIPLNYRRMNLLICTAKICTSIINQCITSFLERYTMLCKKQNGFRAKRSCSDHIYILHFVLKQRQIENKNTFITIIDFSKAFDGVDRGLLLHMLLHSGIEGKNYFVIKALYNMTQDCISLNNYKSYWFLTNLV